MSFNRCARMVTTRVHGTILMMLVLTRLACGQSDEAAVVPEYLGVLADGGKAGRFINDGWARSRHDCDGSGLTVAIAGPPLIEGIPPLEGRTLPAVRLGENTESVGLSTLFTGYSTAMATIIAGQSDTYTGGVAPGAHVMAVECFSADNITSTAMILSSLTKLVQRIENDAQGPPVSVVFLSFSQSVAEEPTEAELSEAAQYQHIVDALVKQNVVVVAPAGNWGATGELSRTGAELPSGLKNVISVGAVSDADLTRVRSEVYALGQSLNAVERGAPAPFSKWLPPGNNFWEPTTLFAPGVAVLAVNDRNEVVRMSGTGPAAATVAGAVLLIQQKCRQLVFQMFEGAGKGARLGLQMPPERWLPAPELVREFLVASETRVQFDLRHGETAAETDFCILNVLDSLNAVERAFDEDLAAVRTGFGSAALGFQLKRDSN